MEEEVHDPEKQGKSSIKTSMFHSKYQQFTDDQDDLAIHPTHHIPASQKSSKSKHRRGGSSYGVKKIITTTLANQTTTAESKLRKNPQSIEEAVKQISDLG